METDIYARLSASELSAGFRAGKFTPAEAADAALALIEERNGRLNAIVAMDRQAIRNEAAASSDRYRTGSERGPLDGVPFVVKDCIKVRGLPTAWGTELFKDEISDVDETPVARLREAGMIVLGKANVPEFALRGFTFNPTFGVTRNPWDADLTCGGSSGGTVSAVAAGFAPLGLGADAGGSIRRPAGFTNLVGLKPSAGVVPRRDALPALVGDYDVVGPVARSVGDLRTCFELIALPDDGVPGSYVSLDRPDPVGGSARNRVLFIEQFRDSPVDSEVAASVSQAAENLEKLGYRVEKGPAPFDTTAFNRSFGPLSRVGLALATEGRDWRHKVSEEFRQSIDAGLQTPGVDYLRALEVARSFREEIAGVFNSCDFIMTPTSAAMPWAATERAPATINGKPADSGAHSVFTGFANIAGCPAISIPAGRSSQNLPVGFHLVAPFGGDYLLMDLASAYERAHPWDAYPTQARPASQ